MPKYIAKFNGTDYKFLSNFWKAEITYEGIKYPSSEHAYQASKTLEVVERQAIADLTKCGDAKRAGRKVTLRKDWDDVKDGIMLDILRIKFSMHPDLKQKLIDTGDAILVEGNTWHDKHFGVCYCDECNGLGKNMLGELLMKVREECKEQQKDKVKDVPVDDEIVLESI